MRAISGILSITDIIFIELKFRWVFVIYNNGSTRPDPSTSLRVYRDLLTMNDHFFI